jgi:hypothetical protein
MQKVLWRARNNINMPFDVGYLWDETNILVDISKDRCGDSYWYLKKDYFIYEYPVEVYHERVGIWKSFY